MKEKFIKASYQDLVKESKLKETIKNLTLKNIPVTLNLKINLKVDIDFNYLNSLALTNLNLIIINNDLTKEEIIDKLTLFLLNIKEKININVEYKDEVEKFLKLNNTYQGFNRSILNYVKREILLTLKDDDIAIDATVGNGYDTLFLVTVVTKGQVYGFDIQKEAIRKAQNLVKDYPDVTLINDSHENINNLKLEKKAKLILFNLGYLPGGNKNITTKAQTTIKALTNSLKVLDNHGKILVVIYPGHEEGKKEKEAILNWLKEENITFQEIHNTSNPIAPFLIIITI